MVPSVFLRFYHLMNASTLPLPHRHSSRNIPSRRIYLWARTGGTSTFPLVPSLGPAPGDQGSAFASSLNDCLRGIVTSLVHPPSLFSSSSRVKLTFKFGPGGSSFFFSIIYNAGSALQQFDQMDGNPNISLSAINDDVNDNFEETDALMRRWFEKKWPIPAAWEAL